MLPAQHQAADRQDQQLAEDSQMSSRLIVFSGVGGNQARPKMIVNNGCISVKWTETRLQMYAGCAMRQLLANILGITTL